MTETIELAILGGGPAGMTAGLYASRARIPTRLIEKLTPGGQILTTHWVDNYPGFPEGVAGYELVDRMRSQAERFGLTFGSGEALDLYREGGLIRIVLDEGELMARALIVATGSQPTRLGIPGEVENTGRGVSYCAVCDGAFFRDQVVAVVGGGDTAVEEAMYLTKFASRVHLFHRRDALRAAGVLQERLLADPKIEIHWSCVLKHIHADDQGLVNGVTFRDLVAGTDHELAVNGVFPFVGQRPTTEFLQGFVELDASGFVITDADLATSQPGVFAAGDVRAKRLRQIATAVGDGANAAYMAEKYLEA